MSVGIRSLNGIFAMLEIFTIKVTDRGAGLIRSREEDGVVLHTLKIFG